ncbi:hypothetical protein Enr13x_05870 [Stieleria neptunia]|uniref:Uncharacterized protein n=1 Tax=Stieleria neptunia TaxID=2527979 RepID=A0A518HIR9_9BACT|nr:hypothetical protein [Stieleria neptunia]QDV40751.1 hypothetical protein Enr13x_05870 [Stieleria neptunia]
MRSARSTFIVLLLLLTCVPAAAHDYFAIKVVDQQTGRGVPMVELKTVNHVRYYTDSAGVVAFDEPGLMNQTVYFHVWSHGYEFPEDGFGYRGTRLDVRPGGMATLKIKRLNIARRLYRITGAGIYRDSVLVGHPTPIKQPVLNGQVFGSDSVVNAVYKGKLHWFWGDTHRPSYPLGNFDVPGAVSQLPRDGGLDPEIGVDLEYFVDRNGFAKPMAKLAGAGPTWINGLVTLDGGTDRARMFAAYVKIKPPLTVYERGLAEFNDQTHRFEKLESIAIDAPLFPGGHPITHQDEGIQYVYFGDPFPLVRVPATAEALRDLSRYEAYTCLKQGSRADSIAVERRNGAPVFSWKSDTIPFTPMLQDRLIREGHLDTADGLFRLVDETGKPVTMHRGSVAWNEHRGRWVMIGVQHAGTSMLGEVWYADSVELTGPWINARKIVSHEQYSFYNPKQHPMFAKHDGRVIFFEGTYTATFSGNDAPTPRYDYNQMMYKLDLADLGWGERSTSK